MPNTKLFESLSKRDFSGSAEDTYAQFLITCFFSVHEDLFPLLEKAHRLNKKLDLKDHMCDEITIDNIIIVPWEGA